MKFFIILMHTGGSRALTSDTALLDLAGAAEVVKEGAKNEGKYITRSTWRLGPLTILVTRLYCQFCVLYTMFTLGGENKGGECK